MLILNVVEAIFRNLFFYSLHVERLGMFPKPLPPEKELEYFKMLSTKDGTYAKHKLIEHNLRLVAHIIKKYYSQSTEQEELISIGTIGLIKAVSTFDYTKGSKFATYASRCIENEILMHFRYTKKSLNNVSINEPVDTDKDGNALTLIDVMADSSNIDDDVDLLIRSEQLYKYIKKALSPREVEIITHRYGLFGNEPLTQREVAKRLNISRSYVSRIEKKALEILKSMYDDNA